MFLIFSYYQRWELEVEGFNAWGFIWGAMNVFVGVVVGIIVAITMRRKGRIALFMVPLVAWQLLWMSWAWLRQDMILEWIDENEYSMNWITVLSSVSFCFWWICVFLALVPAMAKDKSASNSDVDKQTLYD
jgi:hypothetical protein